MSEQVGRVDLIWSSEWKSWGAIAYDYAGNQIGEGIWEPRKAEAKAAARRQWPGVRITSYTKEACL